MKALLVNADLMTRVVVPDDATEEQIIEATIARFVSEINRDAKEIIGESITEWKPDTVIPYGESPTDKK